MSATQDIHRAALSHGWTMTPNPNQSADGVAEYRKGKQSVRIRSSVTGAIVEASTPTHRIDGKGKRERVLDVLAGAAR